EFPLPIYARGVILGSLEKGFMKLVPPPNHVQFSRRPLGSIVLALGILTGGFSLWMTSVPAAKPEDKCTICHVPPGKPNNPQTLTIGCAAAQAHLRNHPGDCMGPCPCQPTPKTNP